MSYAIETIGLSKGFHNINAVQDLNLRVPEGAIYGFIGENGSGKSTTEKLICGLLVPKSGQVMLYGKPNTDPAIRAHIGVLIENPGCFPGSTVYQNLFMQALNLDLPDPRAEVLRVLDLVSMSGAAGRKFKECSLGMKQRLGVAQSLLGHPHTLILDEPINGLDADGMRIVRETLLELNRQDGVTILISSHILGELAKIATHYGILRHGTLIREASADQMSEQCRDFVFVKTNDDARALTDLQTVYRQVEAGDGGVRIYDADDPARASRFLFEKGFDIVEVQLRKVGLEEYYLSIMSEQKEN